MWALSVWKGLAFLRMSNFVTALSQNVQIYTNYTVNLLIQETANFSYSDIENLAC